MLAKNLDFYNRVKDIDRYHHYYRQQRFNKIKIINISTKFNIADIINQSLTRYLYNCLYSHINISYKDNILSKYNILFYKEINELKY